MKEDSILNDRMNLPLNGEPLLEETIQLLKEELKLLAKMKKVQKNKLKLPGLEEFIIPHKIKIIPDEPEWLEPIQFEPIQFEPKHLKTKPQKKSDGWRTPNKNRKGLVYRY